MKPYLQINPVHPDYYYTFFYLLAFLLGFVLLLREGRRRNFQLIPWMLVIATAFLFFMMGCRLITFSGNEWTYLLRFEPIPYFTGRSVLGGILLCVPGILLAKKCLRFQPGVMDAFAYVLPLALMVERFGCLMAGCCYGTPTLLPWAIQYGQASHPFAQHVHDGLLSSRSPMALPIHPVQLYEVLACGLIVLALSKLRRSISAPGNFLLTSIGLYSIVRFLLEFVRATDADSLKRFHLFGINCVQYAILLILPLLVFVILRREKKQVGRRNETNVPRGDFYRPAFYFLMIGFLFFFVLRWLGGLERIAFDMILLPLLIAVAWHLFDRITVPGYRIASALLPLAALLLMNQTLPEYSKNDSTRMTYNTISIGLLGGSSRISDSNSYSGVGCSGTPFYTAQSAGYNNTYSAQALGISRTVQQGKNKSISFGLNGFTGKHHETVDISSTSNAQTYTSQSDQFYSYYGIKPYAQIDGPHFGIGLGFTVGQFGAIGYPRDIYQYPAKSYVSQFSVYPSFSLRVGRLDKVFVEYNLANQFPTAFPAMNHQVSVGFGLRKKNGGAIRVGTASYVGIFIAPSLPIGNHIILESYLGGGPGFAGGYHPKLSNLIGSLNLHYKFNKREKAMKTRD